jgi:hypothetical protein
MQTRTEPHLIGPPARGAEERLARRNFSAVEAKLHMSDAAPGSFPRWANGWASSGPPSTRNFRAFAMTCGVTRSPTSLVIGVVLVR